MGTGFSNRRITRSKRSSIINEYRLDKESPAPKHTVHGADNQPLLFQVSY